MLLRITSAPIIFTSRKKKCMLHLNTIDENIHATLQSLFQADYLSNFALAGGTSLALQLGHRKSIDIDLFAYKDINMQEIALQLDHEFGNIEVNKVSTVFIFCYINNVKADFVNHSKQKLLRPFVIDQGIRMFSIEDIAAMKLSAITGRGTRKDFYDLYVLLQQYSLKDMLNWHDEKFNSDNSWMVIKSLQYFVDADNSPEPLLLSDFPPWSKMKKFFIEKVNALNI
jgi:predicted nucleotidyltransferase component of viral defense system